MTSRNCTSHRSRSVSLPVTTDVQKSPNVHHERHSSRAQPSTTSPQKRRSTRESGKQKLLLDSMKENNSERSLPVSNSALTSANDCAMDVCDESLQLAVEPITPQLPKKQRVLVPMDAQIPHGKRLKRTVRTEHRKVPVPDDVMRKYRLDLSRWECRRFYKSINISLSRTELLNELVSRIMSSDYYREGLTSVDESIRSAAQFLANAQCEPAPRPNPKNKALTHRVAELKKAIRVGQAELVRWERFDQSIAEMEQNRTVLPECCVEPIRISSGDDARKAFQRVVLKCSEADQSLNRIEMQMAMMRDRQKEFGERFNLAVRTGLKHAKTPRKPAMFPRSGMVVADITPRSVDS